MDSRCPRLPTPVWNQILGANEATRSLSDGGNLLRSRTAAALPIGPDLAACDGRPALRPELGIRQLLSSQVLSKGHASMYRMRNL